MDESKKQRLKSQGWKVGTVKDFLELNTKEANLIEDRISSLGKDKGKFILPDDFNVLPEEILSAFEDDTE